MQMHSLFIIIVQFSRRYGYQFLRTRIVSNHDHSLVVAVRMLLEIAVFSIRSAIRHKPEHSHVSFGHTC